MLVAPSPVHSRSLDYMLVNHKAHLILSSHHKGLPTMEELENIPTLKDKEMEMVSCNEAQ